MIKITLTSRDKSILTDLARCRVLSFFQIRNAYWPGAKDRTAQERMERLQKAGYIKVITVQTERPGRWMKIYHLGLKGKKWAIGPEGGMDRKKVFTHPGKTNEIIHQVRTNEVYYRLSESEKATFKIGDVMEIEQETYRGGGAGVPDASYISDGGDEIFIEADIGCYTSKQIREKVESFVGKKTIWVCPSNRKGFLVKHGARGEFFTYRR